MQLFDVPPPGAGPSLALHGGAGGRIEELSAEGRAPYEQGLTAAYQAGWKVLTAGGDALDAVCASVEVLEDDPLFNAGRGAALTATGQAELDASVMTGSGLAGAVAAAKYARNPVQAARALNTQARLLIELSAGQEQYKRLGVAATYLKAYLQTMAERGAAPVKDQVETYAANVLLVAPEDIRPKAD